jgi:EAL domain-containing protein (putative c-di-GMP-specific phosphodiesterase class I)
MYRAKAGGRARSVVFDQGLDSVAVGRLELETELRRALDQGELEVHYQPIVDLLTRRTRDMEALVRWRHPQHGLVAPDRFIPLAEDTGLIIPMGLWVLETACRQLRAWRKQCGDDGLAISVNLSARQFQHPSLVDDIARVLRESGLPPNSLMLEITESIAMRDAESTANILADLKRLGVRLAIDDFGTGYSSLSYLHRFPIDVLKIDRSFVGRLGSGAHNDVAIVEAVIALARGLNMEVTAEGIETADQLARLGALGCDNGQGYYFARPRPAHEAIELLAPAANPDWLSAAA